MNYYQVSMPVQQRTYENLPPCGRDQRKDGAENDRVDSLWRKFLAVSPDEQAQLLRRLNRPECAR